MPEPAKVRLPTTGSSSTRPPGCQAPISETDASRSPIRVERSPEYSRPADRAQKNGCAPVAQMDRASACGAEGRKFESCRAHHSFAGLCDAPLSGSGSGDVERRRATSNSRHERGEPSSSIGPPGRRRTDRAPPAARHGRVTLALCASQLASFASSSATRSRSGCVACSTSLSVKRGVMCWGQFQSNPAIRTITARSTTAL